MAELTPMMQQYLKTKEEYPDCILFYRLGDFYEMFFEDALTVTKELEITLTGKQCGMEERAPMCGVPHHLIDAVEPDAPFSCAEYVTRAGETVKDIAVRGKLPILCGGTGLYLDRFLCGEMEETHADEALRASLFAFSESEGVEALHARLREVDPESADAIHPNNVKRVVRALEIYEQTGIPKSEFDRRSQVGESPYDAVVIGLHYPRREVLYERINRRVDVMLADGLLEETKKLLDEGVFEVNLTAAQAIGYKELLGYLRGEETLSAARRRFPRPPKTSKPPPVATPSASSLGLGQSLTSCGWIWKRTERFALLTTSATRSSLASVIGRRAYDKKSILTKIRAPHRRYLGNAGAHRLYGRTRYGLCHGQRPHNSRAPYYRYANYLCPSLPLPQ